MEKAIVLTENASVFIRSLAKTAVLICARTSVLVMVRAEQLVAIVTMTTLALTVLYQCAPGIISAVAMVPAIVLENVTAKRDMAVMIVI